MRAMAIADAPTPLPVRASHAERERAARLLRASTIDGRISTDTFIERIERALGARSLSELDHLVADVRTPGPLRRAALGAVRWVSELTAEVQAAWRAPRAPRAPQLALPAAGEVTIGRSPDCHCQLGDPGVSRRHAQIHRDGDLWVLRDLGSRNGTWLNGVRVTGAVEVRPGDDVNLGGVRLRAALRAR
jgi:FHA domain/Domain of unknown function (DUF1707)